MNEAPNANTILLIIVAFLVGYAVVSFLVSWLKPRKPQSAGDTSTSKDNQRAQGSSNSWEDKTRLQEEELRRQEEIRRGQEREHARLEEERRRQQEEHRKRSSTGAESRVKDEEYYGNVLGLRGRVTPEDVRKQYRQLVVQYHPDKVNHLGPKLRALAENEMKELNEAFEYFKRKYG